MQIKARQFKPIIKPPKTLLRQIGHAIRDFKMIQPEDHILLGLSGGKDSMSLLHILMHLQKHAPFKFHFAAITIDPLSADFDPSPLDNYVPQLGIPYYRCQEPIVELAKKHMKNDSFCAFCARMKRGLIYKTAREKGYNVVALAQHLDDLAESFFMSAFHGGKLQTMKAHYRNDAGDIRIIRPLVYVRERQLREFAKQENLPLIEENCPACFSHPSERERIKWWLAQEEKQHPHLFKNLLRTMQPLIAEGLESAL